MSKILVAYFSASGHTAKCAKKLAESINADLFEIKPVKPYKGADLNWNNKSSRSTVEMNDINSRPEIIGTVDNLAEYDKIFLGFPIWWYTAPRIISTFLESGDFSGKKIIIFATSGGSGLGHTSSDLHKVCPNANFVDGKILSSWADTTDLKGWAESF